MNSTNSTNNNLFIKKNNSSGNFHQNASYFKDENITKYLGAQNNNVNKPPVLPSTLTTMREFGKDLTNKCIASKPNLNNSSNVINQNQNQNQNQKKILNTKLVNCIKPIKKDKDEKKQFIRNDSSLYNLRPRNLPSMSSKNNSNNNSFSTNNENVNTLNIMNNSNSNMMIDQGEIPQKAKVKATLQENNDHMDVENTNTENVTKKISFNSFINPQTGQENIFKDNFFNFKQTRNQSNSNNNVTNDVIINEDPQKVSEYLSDIFDHLKETEMLKYPKYGYMKSQPDLNEKMRAILIDWLVDVHLKFKLVPETLFITTLIIDRYLEKNELSRNKLQLVGVSALFIACKYEEIYPPELKDFVYVTDKAYNKSDILLMEKEILNALDFDITYPTSLKFLDVYLQLAQTKLDESLYYFARYLLELFLIEYRMIKYPPSWIAAATLYIAIKVKKNNISVNKSLNIPKISGYSEDKLKECARDICVILDNSDKNSLQAVKNKFSSSKFLEVAKWKKN